MMKKMVFMAFAASTLLLTACGNKADAPQANADSTAVADTMSQTESASETPVVSDEVRQLTDQLSQQLSAKNAPGFAALLTDAKAKITELAKTDPEAAKAYVVNLQNWVKNNASAIKTWVSSTGNDAVASAVNTAIGSVTTINPADVVNSMAHAAESDAKQAGAQFLQNAKADVDQAVKNSKVGEAAAQAADAADKAKAAKEAVEHAPDAAKKAARDAANKAADKAHQAAEAANKKAEERREKGKQKAADAVNHAAGEALKGLGL